MANVFHVVRHHCFLIENEPNLHASLQGPFNSMSAFVHVAQGREANQPCASLACCKGSTYEHEPAVIGPAG